MFLIIAAFECLHIVYTGHSLIKHIINFHDSSSVLDQLMQLIMLMLMLMLQFITWF